MGGLLLIGVVIALFFFLNDFILPPGGIIAPLATLVLVGGLGAFDDYLNAKTGEGISARQKMLWLVVVARRRRVPDPETRTRSTGSPCRSSAS